MRMFESEPLFRGCCKSSRRVGSRPMRDDARGRGLGRTEGSPSIVKHLPHNWVAIRREWPFLTVHQRLETSVAFVLTLVIDAVILVALYRLIVGVVGTL